MHILPDTVPAYSDRATDLKYLVTYVATKLSINSINFTSFLSQVTDHLLT